MATGRIERTPAGLRCKRGSVVQQNLATVVAVRIVRRKGDGLVDEPLLEPSAIAKLAPLGCMLPKDMFM